VYKITKLQTYIHVVFQEAIQMSQALEESMRMYEEENRKAPPDESLAVSTALLFCLLCKITVIVMIIINSLSSS